MIDYVMGIFLILFGLGFGILLGWVLSLPKDEEKVISDKEKEFIERKEFNERTSTAYFDEKEWIDCMKDCPVYCYNEPKKKRAKKKK